MKWTDLTAFEPRLADLEAAASATLLADDTLWADRVYVMAKPYIAWLVGWKRGRPIRDVAIPPPPGSALAKFAATALPFPPLSSVMSRSDAYDTACAWIRDRLCDADETRAA